MKDNEDGNIIDQSEDDDILKDLFLEKNDDDNNDNDPISSEEIKALRTTLAEKDKQINGLLQTVKADRRKRQEMKGQLDQVTTTVNSILSQRQQIENQLAGKEQGQRTIDGIAIEFNDDGDAFVPTDKLNTLIKPYEEKIELLERQLQHTNENSAAQRESQQLIQNILGEDERYPVAHSKYQRARQWANERVIDFQRENNIRGPFTSGQALTYVFDDKAMQEFKQEFPGMDLAAVVTGDDSPWHFRQALRMAADAVAPKREPDARFHQVINKPSGLGKSTNAKAGDLSLSERVSALSTEDIMSLTDAQIEALSKFMESDEQTNGVKW